MKISILLPYKENFSPEYAGAVSLFVKDTVSVSSFKKFITVFGNTNYKKGFNIKYHNLLLNKKYSDLIGLINGSKVEHKTLDPRFKDSSNSIAPSPPSDIGNNFVLNFGALFFIPEFCLYLSYY